MDAKQKKVTNNCQLWVGQQAYQKSMEAKLICVNHKKTTQIVWTKQT